MAAYAYIIGDLGRLADERVMAEDFWPDNGEEIEQMIAEVRSIRGGRLLPPQRDPQRAERSTR